MRIISLYYFLIWFIFGNKIIKRRIVDFSLHIPKNDKTKDIINYNTDRI